MPLLSIRGLTKYFGPAAVLSEVDLEVGAGEIHGLVGANGSGKTTLLRMLAGHPGVTRDGSRSGEILLRGQPFLPRSPLEARASGVGMVHQEGALIGSLTLTDNVNLGREPLRPGPALPWQGLGLVDQAASEAVAIRSLAALGVTNPPSTRAGALPLPLHALVETAREVGREDLRLLLLDEPASALDAPVRDRLHEVLRVLARRGVGMLYVSHRLEDLFAVCSTLTVLRDGCVAARLGREKFALERVVQHMSHAPLRAVTANRAAAGRTRLGVRGLEVELPGECLRGLDLDVNVGESVGLAGLSGHGKLALAPGLLGLAPARGQVCWDGSWGEAGSMAAVLRRRCAYIPEDRRARGLLPERGVAENIAFSAVQQGRFRASGPAGRLGLLDRRGLREHAADMIEQLGIVCTNMDQPVGQLSGGNQQKVCLARALTARPELLLVAEPTRGIDLAAKDMVLGLLQERVAEQGLSLVVASSEYNDLHRLCHRIAVVAGGRIVANLPGGTDEVTLTRHMFAEAP